MLRPALRLFQPPEFGLMLHEGEMCWRSEGQLAMPPTPEIQYFDMSITDAKKGKEMRPKCVALTGARVQTRHHPNFKSRSATSSFRCGFHSTAPFVNSVLHSVTVKGINFKIDCTHRKPSICSDPRRSLVHSRALPAAVCIPRKLLLGRWTKRDKLNRAQCPVSSSCC